MTREEIQQIVEEKRLPEKHGAVKLIETHISWVLLTTQYAFKIKKPIRLDFLDFSTLANRLFFCSEELRLNQRLAPDMYLGVLPIGMEPDGPTIGATEVPTIDFAVWMRRLDEHSQMDLLLEKDCVSPSHLNTLATILSDFHLKNRLGVEEAYSQSDYLHDFEDLYHEEKDALLWLGTEVTEIFNSWKKHLPVFINKHSIRMRARFEERFWVEGHGDLHTRNIFLSTPPTVFDCLEFSEHFRKLDVLNEIAFLCMDLEARGRTDLSQQFLNCYCQNWNVLPQPEDTLVFTFFKAYRANIRLKITLIELREHQNDKLLHAVVQYWVLLKGYCGQMGI
jgi:aminoglycoside phosphotransferase family enzyme